MKMYNKNGATADCHKDQKDIMLKAGWSRTPFPVAEEILKKDVDEPGPDPEIEEDVDDVILDEEEFSEVVEVPKKKKRKK